MGASTIASGHSSTAMGIGTRAEAPNSTAIGLYNVGGGDPLLAASTDPLFEIGNGQYIDGTNDIRRNALTVLRNGTITAPSFDINEITDDKALITKEYADANYSGGSGGASTGLEAIDEGNGIGWRLIGRDPANYGSIGSNAVDLSTNFLNSNAGATGVSSVAFGRQTIASGVYSSAFGINSQATGGYSTAFGSNSRAIGNTSIAMGENSEAFGNNTFAVGKDNLASGLSAISIGTETTANANYATAIGVNTTASGIVSTAMGNLTTASGLYSTAMGTNTNAVGDYSTAMGVGSAANGDFSFAFGNLTTANGEYSFATGNRTIADGNYSSTFGNSTQAIAENSSAMGIGTIAGGDNQLVIGQYNNVWGTGVLFQIGNGQDDDNRSSAFLVNSNGNATLFGTLTQSSDIRLKNNIEKLDYGLNEVLQLNPVSYNWKKYPHEQKSLGLIAQDVQKIIREIVHKAKDEDQTLSVSYTEIIPVLIKAIQEQQNIIDNQNKKISNLSAQLEQFKSLSNRISQLESLNNNQQ